MIIPFTNTAGENVYGETPSETFQLMALAQLARRNPASDAEPANASHKGYKINAEKGDI